MRHKEHRRAACFPKSKHLVLHAHPCKRIKRAQRLLAKRISEADLKRIHFLMDFDGAKDEGEVEEAVL
jgi:hypothetical protein